MAEAVDDADVDVDLGVDVEGGVLPVLVWLAVLEGFDVVDEVCMTQSLFWQE